MGDFKKRLKHYQRKRIEIYFEVCYHSMVISSSTECYILLNSRIIQRARRWRSFYILAYNNRLKIGCFVPFTNNRRFCR